MSMLGMSLAGSIREKRKHRPNIDMGGMGGEVWGGGLKGYEIRGLCIPFRNLGFPLFPPGYGHQNAQTLIFYKTVSVRDCYKQ